MVSAKRRKRENGSEILEFAIVFALFAPLMLGAFITGMNLLRSLIANQMCRDLANMYIHGADFSTYPMQQEAQRLAEGLNLQIGSAFASGVSNENSNTSNSGNGIVTVTQVMWVGATTSPDCTAVPSGQTCNSNSFVFTQRIQFGNGTVGGQYPSALGNPTGTALSNMTSAGIIQNPTYDSSAKLPSAGQTLMQNLWPTSGTTGLTDGQVIYVVEVYFQSPDLNISSLSGNGVYARYFF